MLPLLVAIGVFLATSACTDCPRSVDPKSAADPVFLLARDGRIAAAWDGRKLGGDPSIRFLTGAIGGAARELRLAGIDEGAIGTRSVLALEAGTGLVAPRRAALLLDDTVRIITLDLPILMASVVFDGSQYQVVYIDRQDIHIVSIDEDGNVGVDFTVTPRPQSDLYLIEAATDGAGDVVVTAPMNQSTEVISIDPITRGVRWRIGTDAYTRPLFYKGYYRMLYHFWVVSVSRSGVASSTPVPGDKVHTLFASTEALYGVTGGVTGYSVVRFDPSVASHQPVGIVLDGMQPSLSLSYTLTADGERILAYRRSPNSPRDLSIIEYSSQGDQLSSNVVAKEGELVEHGPCTSPN